MPKRTLITVDGNEAAASVAFRVSEAIAIFPITPSSTMAELCDEWAGRGKTNLWGVTPEIAAMQSEGGAAGARHGGSGGTRQSFARNHRRRAYGDRRD